MCGYIWVIALTWIFFIYIVIDWFENWERTKYIIGKYIKKTNKEKYEEIITDKKLKAIKLWKYKIKYEDDYWIYIYIDWSKDYELFRLTLYRWKIDRSYDRYEDIIINWKEYHYNKSDLKKQDKQLQIIFKQILKQNEIKDKQEKKEAFIQEEIEYAEKIKDLMQEEIKTSKKVKEEFNPLFKKAESLNKITNEAIKLMKEAKKIRNEF